MSERDFVIGNIEFKLSKMDAFKQFHVVRRMGPILSDLLPSLKDMAASSKKELNEEEKLDQIAKFVSPIMNGLSKLSDDDADKVLLGLLSCVEMKQSQTGNWARVVNGNNLMFSNLELPILLQAAGKAFMFNLSGFFAALPSHS